MTYINIYASNFIGVGAEEGVFQLFPVGPFDLKQICVIRAM